LGKKSVLFASERPQSLKGLGYMRVVEVVPGAVVPAGGIVAPASAVMPTLLERLIDFAKKFDLKESMP
jgi:hypothetical protein